MPKRKTTTSTEVKQRWIDANYKRVTISLRYDQDRDLIDYIENHSDIGTTELIRRALNAYLTTEEPG